MAAFKNKDNEITVSTPVQVGSPPRFGVVRWIGSFPGSKEVLAGIELDEFTDKCGDGTFEGISYFSCAFGHAYFHPVTDVKPDSRFTDHTDGAGPGSTAVDYGIVHGFEHVEIENPLQGPLTEAISQPIPPCDRYLGDKRGIQGHHNSCYLDATIFGLFALCNSFDFLLQVPDRARDSDSNTPTVGELLTKGIVNPLRKNGVVRYESVMEFRKKIEELGKMEGITTTEKDPEEFLNMLFKHILHVPPFIRIRREFGTEDEFFVQLFTSVDENIRLPTLRVLMKKMFDEGKLSLTEAPSKLLIQVPRYGREFKTHQKIVPDLKFDVSDFTDSYKQAVIPDCMICEARSSWECSACISEFFSDSKSTVHFCDSCSEKVHSKKRRDHDIKPAFTTGESAELDLLSVICIETSHYVCFTRDLYTGSWIFFDSMADREYDMYNIPKVTDCTQELNDWVYARDLTRLMSTESRKLPQLVRRYTQDVYMCVYVHSVSDIDVV